MEKVREDCCCVTRRSIPDWQEVAAGGLSSSGELIRACLTVHHAVGARATECVACLGLSLSFSEPAVGDFRGAGSSHERGRDALIRSFSFRL